MVNSHRRPVVLAWAHDTGADLAKTNDNGGAVARRLSTALADVRIPRLRR
jgi:hypothetical protein